MSDATLTFDFGEPSTKTISVATIDDDAPENDEMFAIGITATGVGNVSPSTAIGTILDNDTALDFGDAPDDITVDGVLRHYPTFLGSDGARHAITTDAPFLGLVEPDSETDGQPNSTATGDDVMDTDDQDVDRAGAIVLTAGQSLAGIEIEHNGGTDGGADAAFLNAWIDLNQDGDWDDSGERILTDVVVPAGPSSTSLANVTIPIDAVPGTTFARVRISTQSGLTASGFAPDGEVEDVFVQVMAGAAPTADLSLNKTADKTTAMQGETVTFTVTLTNDGPDAATNIQVADVTPGGFAAFVFGAQLGNHFFSKYGVTVDVVGPSVPAIGVGNIDGVRRGVDGVNCRTGEAVSNLPSV